MTISDSILDNPNFERQIELEARMRSMGIERFRSHVLKSSKDGSFTDTQAGSRLVGASHEKMAAAITAFIDESTNGKAGRRFSALRYLQELDDVDVAANLTARCVLDGIIRAPMLTTCAGALGGMIEDEVNSRLFHSQMPKAWAKFHDKAKKESLSRRQWSHLLFPARLMNAQLVEWPDKDKLLLGIKLIELFIESTGLITMELIKGESANSTIYRLSANPETLSWIEAEHNKVEALFPVYMPTIIPPKPWTTPFDGGYYSRVIASLKLVKTRNRDYLQELATRDMPEVYAAVNALQDTAWRINPGVLDVMQRIYATGSGICDLPKCDNIPIPTKPHWMPTEGKMKKEDMTEAQAEEFTRWKASAAQVHAENARQIKARAQFLRTISVASYFKDEEAIYFPHQLDWRGRAYPVPLYLTPQGNDIQRALLTFANAVPIADETDAGWLAIHGAGLWGVDKVSLEDRIQWVWDHSEEISAAGEDPFENRFWTTADKPWSALAFCLEWAGFIREGYGFESTLPVQMDGTCNGLQNFSAMLRDPVGGAAVNLIPADRPQDIYQRVADEVRPQLEQDLASDKVITAKFTTTDGEEVERTICTISDLARGWLPKLSRKVTKRPVMTLAYGAKQFGFVTQIDDDTIKPWRMEDPESYPFKRTLEDGKEIDYGYQAALYMGRLTWTAVGRVVIAARAAMDWLQVAATASAKQGLPVSWTTPSGFLVSQAYRKPITKLVETTFNKTRIRLTHITGLGAIDSRRQAAGISPNWIHSLDASHLAKTITACRAEGITSFSMIHDSYGTHAGNAGVMADVLRYQFVRMYADVDVLGVFKRELEQQLGETLPDCPPMGDLDLNQVMESPFFFA